MHHALWVTYYSITCAQDLSLRKKLVNQPLITWLMSDLYASDLRLATYSLATIELSARRWLQLNCPQDADHHRIVRFPQDANARSGSALFYMDVWVKRGFFERIKDVKRAKNFDFSTSRIFFLFCWCEMLLLKRVETCSDSIMFGVTEGILENDIAEKIENVSL